MVNELKEELRIVRAMLEEHLREGVGVKTQLAFNTWLTGVILVALLSRYIVEWFK